jgi:thiol-disulfide isomerase/thioredoxin
MNKGGDMFKYNVHYITSTYEKSKVMGMDAVVACMFDEYYRTGDAFWMGEEQLEKFRDKVDKVKPLLINEVTPNIILHDTSEQKGVNLQTDSKSDYTVLYFWDPTCGHCKKELPKLKKFYDSIKENTDIDIEVLAVCTKLETEGWKEYIIANDLNWINISDNPEVHNNPEKYLYSKETTLESLNFRQTYDIFSTPRGFLLDKDKKIKAKQFEVENLNDILNQLIRISELENEDK